MIRLQTSTQRILKRVEDLSGKSIQFMRDESLQVLSTLQIARNGAEFHVLRYQPSDKPIDYLVAYQAGFALRMFQNPPEERFDFVSTDDAVAGVSELVKTGQALSEQDLADLPKFSEFVAHWALMNLRSLPVGMRIDQWIATEYPELKVLQLENHHVQQQMNMRALTYQQGNLTLPVTLMGTLAAFALFSDKLAGQVRYAIPFSAAGVIDDGKHLLKLLDTVPKDPTHDMELVEKWADACGMSRWFKWNPYQP
jgi:hypothetical protein